MKASTLKTIKQLCKRSAYAEVLYLVRLPDGTEKEIKGTSDDLKRYAEKTGAVLKDVIIRTHDEWYSPVLQTIR